MMRTEDIYIVDEEACQEEYQVNHNLGSTLTKTINKNIGELIHIDTWGFQIDSNLISEINTCFNEYHEAEEVDDDDEDEWRTIRDGELLVDSLNEDLLHVNWPNNVDEVM